jgi:nudix-type nucleoside diphosphatase (YffH/AdpP family)
MIIEALALTHERWSRLFVATIRGADGPTFERDIEDHGEAAGVLPYDPVRRVALLIRQKRAPCLYARGQADIIEVPAGRLDEDAPEACARREALEESGVALKALEFVAHTWSMPGLSTERAYFFLAEYDAADRVSPGGGLAEENESIAVIEVGLAALATMADRGEVEDLKTLMLVQTLRLRRPDLFG